MRRHASWIPALAAPLAVLGHVVSESLAGGRPLLSVAWEPSHAVILLLALAAMPLWFRAAASRRLGSALFAFIALSLLLEGNGLGVAALLVAVAVSLALAWLSGWAIERVSLCAVPIACVRCGLPPARILAPCVPRYGPYFAFVPTRGNRPPPFLACRLSTYTF
ncbi:MAG TPA: hypothetical protein VMA98_01530 [Candidatus Acidoferrales bacterium]|nr:hypothetical protein [Candidatus Acidoferrales bacterium]